MSFMTGDWLNYSEDVRRENPGSDRQGAFKRGWNAAVKGEDESSRYSDDPNLEKLTWDNLGYRLGSLFGETSDELQQKLFEWCVTKQERIRDEILGIRIHLTNIYL